MMPDPVAPSSAPGTGPSPVSLSAPPVAIPPGAPAAAQAAPSAPPAPAVGVPEWLTGSEWVPPEMRADKTLARYKTPAEALKALSEQHKVISAGLTKIPGPEATPAEIQTFREKLGVPKDVTGYSEVKLQAVEGLGEPDAARIDSFAKPAFHKIGLTPMQAQEVLNLFGEYLTTDRRAVSDTYINGQESLRNDWGLNFDANVTVAQRGMLWALGGYPEVLNLFKASQLDMHPDMIRAFHKVGSQLAEDGLVDGSVRGALTPQEIEAKIQEIRASMLKVNAGTQQFRDLEAEMDRLYKTRYGTGPMRTEPAAR